MRTGYNVRVSRRPAAITQAEVARIVRGARQAGAAEVEVRVGEQAKIFIRFALSTGETELVEASEIVL